MDYQSGNETNIMEARVTFASERVIQLVQTTARGDVEKDVTMTGEWNQVSSANGGVFVPHNGLMRFPMRPGDAWESSYTVKFPRRGAFEVQHERKVRVLGWEDVEVPAGKFRALKVESEGSFQRLDKSIAGTAKEVVWYVPEVKRFVKWTFENTARGRRLEWRGFELLGYQVQ
jgi:hypothetical protein